MSYRTRTQTNPCTEGGIGPASHHWIINGYDNSCKKLTDGLLETRETKPGNELRITIRNTECRNITRKRGGNYPLDGTNKFKNPRHIGDKREDHRKKNHP